MSLKEKEIETNIFNCDTTLFSNTMSIAESALLAVVSPWVFRYRGSMATTSSR